jgi:hypothetical protein
MMLEVRQRPILECAGQNPGHSFVPIALSCCPAVQPNPLTKESAIIYNEFLTLSGIPPEVFDYKLGNRSALEWIIDQYRVTKDDQGNIVSDPNRADDEKYIVNLIEKVITVSLETIKIVNALPALKERMVSKP